MVFRRKMEVFIHSYHQDDATVGLVSVKGFVPQGESNVRFFGHDFKKSGMTMKRPYLRTEVYSHMPKGGRRMKLDTVMIPQFSLLSSSGNNDRHLDTGVDRLASEFLGNIPYLMFNNGLVYTAVNGLPAWFNDDLEGVIKKDFSTYAKSGISNLKEFKKFYDGINSGCREMDRLLK